MSELMRARLQLLATAVLFSTGGAGIKATAMTSWQVAGFRSAAAALALLVFMRASPPLWSLRACAVGCAYGATMTFFVLGNKLTTAANTIYLQSTAPLYILLIGPWLLREHLRRSDLAFMAALACGLVLFFVGTEQPYATAPDPATGNLIALLSGVAWAFTITGLRWLKTGSGEADRATTAALVTGNVIAFVVCLPFAFPLDNAAPADWLIVAALGVFQVALSYVLLSSAVHHVPALEASLLLLIEPVLNPVWAWLLHGERPGPWSIAGGAIILAATAVKTAAGAAAAEKTATDEHR